MINWYGDPIRGFRASVFDVVEMRINYAHMVRSTTLIENIAAVKKIQ